MAFEAELDKPLSWSHMMVLRPKKSGCHRTIGLAVGPLRVLSRLRRPLAQKWENEHDAPYFWGCQGKACDRAAWAHSIMVAAAKGRQQSAASLLLDLAKFYEHVEHDHLREEGRKTSSPTRLLACWCVSFEGWRSLEADKCATVPFWAFGTILPGCSGATTAAKLSCWQPFWKQWQRASRPTGSGTWSTTYRGTWRELPRWCRSSLPKREGCWWKASRHAICRFPRANPKSSSMARTSSNMPFCSSWRRSGSTSATRPATWGPICNWEGGGGRSSSRGGWRGLQRERSASGSCARQGHTLASLLSLALMQGCFGFRGFVLHSDTAPIYQSRRGQSHIPAQPRTKRSHNDAGQCPGGGGQKHRPGFPTSSTGHLGLGDGSLGRYSRPRHHAGCAARLPGQAQPSQGRGAAPRTQRPPLCSRSCGWAGARNLRGTSRPTTAPRSISWQWRPKRWATGWTRHPLCGPTAPHTGTTPRARFSGKPSGHSLFQASLVTLASERAGQAGFARHKDPGEACAAQGLGRRPLPALQRRTRRHVPPLLRMSGLAGRARHARLTGGALWVHNTGNSLHMAFFLTLAPFCQLVSLNASASSCGTTGPQTGFWRGTFSRTALRRAAVRCDELAGLWWRSTTWGTSRLQRMEQSRATFCQGSPLEMAKIMQRPWESSSHRIRSRSVSTAKAPSQQSMGQSTKPWEPRAPAHTSGTGVCFPTTRPGRSRSRVMRQSATRRRGELPTCAKGETTLQTPSPKKEQTHTQACLSGCQNRRCLCLPGQASGTVGGRGPRLAQVQGVERHQGCCATSTGTAATSETQAKAAKGDCSTNVGPGVRLAFTTVPSRFSQDSHLDPRTSRGHSLQLGRVFDAGGRASDHAIIFCAKCGAVYWEHADALRRRCSEFPGAERRSCAN